MCHTTPPRVASPHGRGHERQANRDVAKAGQLALLMLYTECSHQHIASMYAHQVVHMRQPSPHAIVDVTHSHHHPVTNSTPMCTQEKLMYKSINCPKPDCGAPMTLRNHKGLRKMVCTKHKCRALTREFVSCYFDYHGAPHSLSAAHINTCPCMHHTSPSMPVFISLYIPIILSFALSLLYTSTFHAGHRRCIVLRAVHAIHAFVTDPRGPLWQELPDPARARLVLRMGDRSHTIAVRCVH